METAPVIQAAPAPGVVAALRRPVVAGCALVAIALAAYLPALGAGFVFDDTMYLLQDGRIHDPGGLWRIWTEVSGPEYRHQWYPLTSSVWWLQWQLWGANPVGYHAINVLLHGLCAVLLWRVLAAVGAPGAWLAGAIFAVHPVHVASVAWVSELKNVLSCVFMLASLLSFLRGSPRGIVLGWGLFAAALASKTATASLPAALGLLWFYRDGRLGRREVGRLALLAVVAIAAVGLTAYLEWLHRAGGEPFAMGLGERLRVASAAVWFYAGKLALPWNLMVIYPRWDPGGWAWWTWAWPLSVALVVALLWRGRARLGRGPVCAVVFYLVAVAPVSLANVAYTRLSFVADHWVYWGSLGLIALAAGGAVHAWRRLRVADEAWARRAMPVATAALIALAAGATWRRAMIFESQRTLWQDTVRRNGDCQLAHYNLAVALTSAGEIPRALEHFGHAARLDPEDADTYNGLGDALMTAGDLAGACRAFGRALALQPHYPEAHYNLGNALKRDGRLDAAMVHYRMALVQRPDYSNAHNNLGTVLAVQGRRDRAMTHFRAAVRADPRNLGALYNLGLACAESGLLDEAADHFRAVLAHEPSLVAAATALARVEHRAGAGP